MRLDLSRLLDGETARVAVECEYPAGYLENASDMVFDQPFCLTGEASDHSGYMNISLHADVPYSTVCSRCLAPLRRVCHIDIEKTLAEKDKLERADGEEVEDDYLLIEQGEVDLDAPLREQLYIELPWKVLCREDCRGLCPQCGADLNDGDCECVKKAKKVINPAFAALGELYGSDKPGDDGK